MLAAAGWLLQDAGRENLFAGTGVAVREARTATGPADYLLYVNQKLVGVIEAKREGTVLSPVERQSARYAEGLTASQQLQAWRLPLPFRYETTAVETHFTNALDPQPRAREVFSFHQPGTLARWMREAEANPQAPTLRARLRRGLPPLDDVRLRPAQADAVTGLERSLAQDRPRALIQMATGAGKTFAAVSSSYRLLKHAGAERILFLVDRNNLGRQAHTEFTGYVTPDDGRKLAELYGVERLAGASILASSKVVISTVQRVYAMLRGSPLPDADADDPAYDDYDADEVIEVGYNPAVPPETFDVIIVDECHRSIYGRWRAVLEYFDAYLVGLTATPVKQTFGFFHQNLISEYTYQQAVADSVNVDFEVYRIRTRQTEQGDTIEAGTVVPRRDRRTRRQRYEELDDDFSYGAAQVGKDVISKGQLRLVLETFRDRLFTEIFPPAPGGQPRRYVPKTLIYARDDNHAEEIVQMAREVFGEGNDFARKITYSAQHPDRLLAAFRTAPELRIAVTVDLIATGTDVKPIECVFFLRDVKSWAYFEQMKGRGARTLDPAELHRVTPDVTAKDHFVIVDAVGVTDSPRVDAAPMQMHSEQQISLKQLLAKAGNLTISLTETSTLCSRLARLSHDITADEHAELEQVAGMPLHDIIRSLSIVTDSDRLAALPPGDRDAERALVTEGVQPLAANPDLRARLLEIRHARDITYHEGVDTLREARGIDVTERARHTAEDIKTGAGQYFTPRALISAMVDCIQPGPDDTIADPACGTGGFLLAAHDYIQHHYGAQLTPEQRERLAKDAITGTELVDGTARLAAMNMLVHGIGRPTGQSLIEVRDSLAEPPHSFPSVVLANPPFGKKSSITVIGENGSKGREDIAYNRQDFWVTTTNKQLNFVQHIAAMLKPPGRAAVVVPDNVLFEGGAGETVRRRLLRNFDVHTLLRLPTGIFYAGGVKANVLFFDKPPARPDQAWTSTLWVYDFRGDQHFTLKQNRMERHHLDDFVACYRPGEPREKREPTERFRPFGYEELTARDKANLDITLVRDPGLDDADSLLPPEVIAREIVEDLEAALDEFAAIAASLQQAKKPADPPSE